MSTLQNVLKILSFCSFGMFLLILHQHQKMVKLSAKSKVSTNDSDFEAIVKTYKKLLKLNSQADIEFTNLVEQYKKSVPKEVLQKLYQINYAEEQKFDPGQLFIYILKGSIVIHTI